MSYKKILSIVTAVIICLSFCGCKSISGNNSSGSTVGQAVVQGKTADYMTLLYSAADTFNPYTVKTDINRQLCMLLYEPLVKLDNSFEPQYALAKTVTLKDKRCVVTINDAVFSDGTAITADDVVYSCNLALKSQSAYQTKLYEVASVSAADGKTVEFVLKKADPYFANLLDFPIIKKGSDTVTDSDGVAQPPVGGGRYMVSEDKQSLVINTKYSGKQSSIKRIELINAPDSESVEHYAQIGAADMYYSDISDGEILRISGTKYDLNLNNLVYIGINKNVTVLNERVIRQALSSGIDRSKICRDSYYNNAVAATGFFNPAWKATASVQNIQITANRQITIENLEKIGYNRLDSKGIRMNSGGERLSFTMLVNSENRIRVAAAKSIAEQLIDSGIKITVVEKSYAEYLAALTSGEFQLFLGEVKLTDNMDISCLVTEGASAAYGLYKQQDDKDEDSENTDNSDDDKEEETELDLSALTPGDVVTNFYEGENAITDIASVLQNDMPFVPVCYRTGVLFCNENIDNIESFSASDIYSSIDSYIINQ